VARAETTRCAVVICPVVPYPPMGGGHKRTLRLLEAIERAGAQVHLVTDDADNPAGAEALRERGWRVSVLPPHRQTPRARAIQHARRLPSPYLGAVAARVRELVAEGCAFVQAEHTQSAYYGAAIAPAPWVLSLHNVDSELARSMARHERPLTPGWASAWNRWHSMRTVERRMLATPDAVLCVSDADRARLAEARRVLLVPNGVDDEFFYLDSQLPDHDDVLFFGQLDYSPNEHGIGRFLREGWPAVTEARPGARLRIVGRGMTSSLGALVERTEGAEAVGFAPDLTGELRRARLVVVPLWQGGGTRLKVLESMAAARPVAGTPLGVEGIGFEDGRHGLVGETARELADACVQLLSDRERARALATVGRTLAERFSWERVTEPAERLYRDWLG
jgi:glycosyltransferase involved in cell wall biosynthesis